MFVSGKMCIISSRVPVDCFVHGPLVVCLAGVYEGRFQLSYPVHVGTWHIVVDAFVSLGQMELDLLI